MGAPEAAPGALPDGMALPPIAQGSDLIFSLGGVLPNSTITPQQRPRGEGTGRRVGLLLTRKKRPASSPSNDGDFPGIITRFIPPSIPRRHQSRG